MHWIKKRDCNESEFFHDKLLTVIGFEIDHVDEGDFGKLKSYVQGEHNIWIRYDRQKESEEFVRNVGLDLLAFELNSETEVDKIYEIVKKLNVKITREPTRYPEYSDTYFAFFFCDPNGIYNN